MAVVGNKGGVAIELTIGKTKIVVVNAHLAAGQNGVKQVHLYRYCIYSPNLTVL